MKATITPLLKFQLVEVIKNNVFPTYANTYLGIGRPIRWGDENDPESNTEIEDVVYTTDYRNQTFRDLIAIKKVEAADTALVVPRRDWAANTVYDEYDSSIEMFSHTGKITLSGTANATGNLIVANTAVFSGNLSTGNIVTLNAETRQIIGLNASHIVVNTNFTYAVTDGTVVKIDNTYPYFANNFYVRNSKDQVFKCLQNANNANSTIEPTIDIDGQLPENPYILTSDNYKWKYLYTIPYGLKQRFFTSVWMPVITDAAVVAGAVDGRIDIVHITDGGSGYFLDNGESGNSNSLSIITVTGDGSGASITAKVESGVITDVNVLNGGTGYTRAELLIVDSDQLSNGTPAVANVHISPPNGHGSNPVTELGCYSVMTSVNLQGTEDGAIPVGSDAYPFDFRQITLLRDPLDANGDYANASTYRTTTKISLTDPGTSNYLPDETVFSGAATVEDATFTATVVYWDFGNNELYVNNMQGETAPGETLKGDVSSTTATVLEVEAPEIELFTGSLLYIENRQKIVRDADQTEQIRLVLSF